MSFFFREKINFLSQFKHFSDGVHMTSVRHVHARCAHVHDELAPQCGMLLASQHSEERAFRFQLELDVQLVPSLGMEPNFGGNRLI